MLSNKLSLENKIIVAITAVIMVITITVCFLLLYFPNLHNAAITLSDTNYRGSEQVSVLQLLRDESRYKDINMQGVDLKEHQLRLALPDNVNRNDISFSTSYVDRTLEITIKGIDDSYFYDYPMIGASNNIQDIVYYNENRKGVIDIVLDDVVEPRYEFEDKYVYLDFVDPHDIYDYVIVVDAGHGGNVPGAIKQNVTEKDIDLQIVLALKQAFDNSDKNIGVYYTRVTDNNPSFASRVSLANDSEADLFISVHNNSTASGRMSSISGTEVMYKATDQSGDSKHLAEVLLYSLTNALESRSKGVVVGDEIYIIRESKVPVALIEVGFMTNKEELAKLCDSAYQKKCAKAIYDSCIHILYNNDK